MHDQQVTSYLEASGTIAFNMTNDYMFRFILQKNKKVLKGLICSLLHLKPDQIKSIEVTNPVNLSEDIAGKDFILDIHVILNNNTLINLEMQIANEQNWPERSLIYLCRAFDQLHRGQKYDEILPVFHIGFLDFTLFPDFPEFYATHMLTNIKNCHVYSDKFVLSVVDLSKIELATKEDKSHGIDYWARVFKAKTWEELKMLAKDNEYLQEAADSLYKANADEIIRQKCLAREDAERRERTLKRDNRLLKEELSNLKKHTADLEKNNIDLKKNNADLEKNNANLEKNNADLEKSNANLEKNNANLEKNNASLEKDIIKLKELVNELQDKLQKR